MRAIHQKQQQPKSLLSGSFDSLWAQRPSYNGITDVYGNVRDSYKVNTGPAYQSAMADYNKLRDEANAQGPSAWAALQMEQQKLQSARDRENLDRSAAGAANEAMTNLGMSGGYDSGARLHLQQEAARNSVIGKQSLAAEAAKKDLAVRLADEQQKAEMRSRLPGMGLGIDQYRTGIDQFNATNALRDNALANDQRLTTWQDLMKAWGANKTADAQVEASQQKKGLVSGLFSGIGL